jgi:general secretion pathway protein L
MTFTPIRYSAADFRRNAEIILAAWREHARELTKRFLAAVNHPRSRQLTLCFESDQIVVLTFGGTAEEFEIGSISRQQDKRSVAIALGELCCPDGISKDVSIQLSSTILLCPEMHLPATSHRNLRGIVKYELARVCPIAIDEIYFDITNHPKRNGRRKIRITARLVEKSVVNEAVDVCHAAGLGVSAISFSGQSRDADWSHFPIDRQAMVREYIARWRHVAWAAAVPFLFVIFVWTAYTREQARTDLLQNEATQAAAEAGRAAQIGRQIEGLELAAGVPYRAKKDPMLSAVLSNLSNVLPDDTYITSFELHQRTIRIEGFSVQASRLLALLDHSNRFANAQFEAPVMQEPGRNIERFALSAGVTSPK